MVEIPPPPSGSTEISLDIPPPPRGSTEISDLPKKDESRKSFDPKAMIESAAAGGLMGVAAPEATYALGKGLSYIPYGPAKAAGYALQAGAPFMGRVFPAITGFLGGGTGETAGQVSELVGAPKPVSESSRILGSMVPDALTGGSKVLADLASKKLIGVPATKVAKTFFEKMGVKEELVNEQERKEINNLIEQLRGASQQGQPQQEIYKALEQKVGEIQADIARRVPKMEKAATEAERIASQRTATAKQNISSVGDPNATVSDVGEKLRTITVGPKASLEQTRSADYKKQLAIRDAAVAEKEGNGIFVQSLPEFKEAEQELRNNLLIGRKAMTQETAPVAEQGVKNAYQKIYDAMTSKLVKIDDPKLVSELQSQGLKIIKKTNPQTGELAFYREFPTSFQALDDVRRKLGDAAIGYGKEGYEALSQQIAKKWYGKISDIQSKFAGESHDLLQSGYEAPSGLLEKYKTSVGKKYTAIDMADPTKYRTNPTALVNDAFGSRQGVQDAINLSGGNVDAVKALAKDFVASNIANKDAKAVSNWLSSKKNVDFLSHPDLAEVRQAADAYLNQLRQAETLASRGTAAKEFLTREVPKIESTAKTQKEAILGDKYPVARIKEIILSGSPETWSTIGPIVSGSPQAMAALPDAVNQVMAQAATTGRTSAATAFREKVAPALQNLMPAQQIGQVQQQLDAIAGYSLPEQQKLTMAQNLLTSVIRNYVVPRITSSAIGSVTQ